MKKNLKFKIENLKLSETEVVHVAKLANLVLTTAEVKKFQSQLSETLAYIAILDKISTQKLLPTSQVTGLENVYRPDEISAGLPLEEALRGAKEIQNNMFKTKAIFQDGTK